METYMMPTISRSGMRIVVRTPLRLPGTAGAEPGRRGCEDDIVEWKGVSEDATDMRDEVS